MPMTRSDYAVIAQTLHDTKPDMKSGTVGERMVWTQIVRKMVKALREANPRFDKARFLNACGATVGSGYEEGENDAEDG